MDLSIIIVNWNTRQLLLDCISSIFSTTKGLSFEVVLVDNGSTDGSVEAVSSRYREVTIITNQSNQGFAKASNAGLRRMQGEYAVLINTDVILTDGALAAMFGFMEDNRSVGMCGPQLLNRDGSKQTSVGIFPSVWGEFASRFLMRFFRPSEHRKLAMAKTCEFRAPASVECIMGACMMVRKAAIDHVGMFDEDFFLFYEEIEWCSRMLKGGWPVYHLPSVAVYHLGGESRKKIFLRGWVESWRSRYLFIQKHLSLSRYAMIGVYAAGFNLALMRSLGYGLINILTLFSLRSPRRRGLVFSYILAWHLLGMPWSMGLSNQLKKQA